LAEASEEQKTAGLAAAFHLIYQSVKVGYSGLNLLHLQFFA